MIVALSTSSPWASVAVFSEEGTLIASHRLEAPRRASEACLTMLEEFRPKLAGPTRYIADVGPGGFSAIKVGVTLAKTLAFVEGTEVAGVSSFDLIDPTCGVAVPIQRGKFLVRVPGHTPTVASEPPGSAIGYGIASGHDVYPDASGAGPLMSALQWMHPAFLVPSYLAMPSISSPKKPYRQVPSCG